MIRRLEDSSADQGWLGRSLGRDQGVERLDGRTSDLADRTSRVGVEGSVLVDRGVGGAVFNSWNSAQAYSARLVVKYVFAPIENEPATTSVVLSSSARQ